MISFSPIGALYLLIAVIFIYFVAMHAIYLILIVLGALEQKKFRREICFGEFSIISHSAQTFPVSVIISAFNEEKMIVATVENVLQLRYPQFEIVVVNDGSVDGTMAVLTARFGLRLVHEVFQEHILTKPVRGLYRSPEYPQLLVVDKENGRRADANNAGVNHARYPLICQIDADCILEEDSLLYMVRPFLGNSDVIAATGIIRPSNGLVVSKGRIVSRGLPDRWLPLFQWLEYLRAFQWARGGLSRMQSMLCMSGAYTFIKREVFLAVGGANPHAVVDDFELTLTLNRYIHTHKKKRRMKIAYVPDPGCYSEVPETLKALASQRNFWQRTLLQSIIWNRDMMFNPRYGLAGMFGMPFFFFFEAISAVVEATSYIIASIALCIGMVTPIELLLIFSAGVLSGSFVSVVAVLMQEGTRMRQRRVRDLLRLLLAGLVEFFGYHQLHVLFSLKGIFDLLVR
ncbi:glycosyltransferase family 2 protein, partial [Chlorobium phaeovibrioides]